jgi:peptide/nickel transport system permease protein
MDETRFTDLELEETQGSAGFSATAPAVSALCAIALAALFVYDYTINPDLVAFRQLDWPLTLAVVFVAVYGIVPLARRPALARRGLSRLGEDRKTLVALVTLVGFLVVGLVGPFLHHEPIVYIRYGYQPPVGLSVSMDSVTNCAGAIVDGRCQGSWRFPLGTAHGGFDVLIWSVYGLRVVAAVVLVAGLVIAGIGTAAGALGGYFGGRLDELLMRYVDIQQVVPAFLVYVVLRLVLEGSLFTLVFVFGLLNWGGTARLVRSETRAVKESDFVTAARSAGAGRLDIVWRHVVPNVAGAALTSTSNRLGTLVLAEASLSFLDLGPPQAHSLGRLAAIGLTDLRVFPWVSTVPVAILAVTAIVLGIVGEGVRSAFDPRS